MVTNPFSDGISVNVSANTGDFRRGINSAEESLSDFSRTVATTTGPLEFLQDRLERTGDELRSMGRAAGSASRDLAGLGTTAVGTSGALGSLVAPLNSIQISLAGISTSGPGAIVAIGGLGAATTGLLSTLVPLAAILGTVTAGVTALAGAFGTVIGTGILAFGEERAQQAQEQLETLQQRRQEIEQMNVARETQIERQQTRIEAFQSEREQLRNIRNETGTLTDAQQRRLATINEEIEQSQANVETLQSELQSRQEKLDTIDEEIDQTEEQTSVTGALGEEFANLRDELIPIIADFGQRFVPLIEDALDAVPQLVQNILDAVGGLSEFRRELRNLGQSAMQVLPDVTSTFFDLARRSLPVFRNVLAEVGRIAPQVFDAMLRTTQRLGPEFARLINTFVAATPEANSLGSAILERVVPALSDLIRFFEDIVQFGQQSDGFVGFVRSAVQRLVQWVQGPGQSVISGAITALLDTITALLGGGEGDTVFSALQDLVSTGLTRLSNWFNAGGQEQITQTLTNLFTAISNTLTNQQEQFASDIFQPLQNILASLFDSIANALASDEAGRLSEALTRTSQAMLNTIADAAVAYVSSDAFIEDISQLATAIANTLGTAVFESLASGGGPAFNPAAFGAEAATEAATGAATSPSGQRVQQAREDITPDQREFQLNVEGDGLLADAIREGAELVVQERERRSTRLQRRTP